MDHLTVHNKLVLVGSLWSSVFDKKPNYVDKFKKFVAATGLVEAIACMCVCVTGKVWLVVMV